MTFFDDVLPITMWDLVALGAFAVLLLPTWLTIALAFVGYSVYMAKRAVREGRNG